ncbi:terminal uridylyltransferase [Fistulifera solaris]|uniref:Terminal uridylyltransferase n=1 Tax=Fistulifera solaris TaxID=1519565 RepID=A0A1Z5JRZ3_FISSO|nr:terminal uridylyltransferase [Fistulifera solaris]|eukprot:GAX16538.1 terminal uridylyltransferase [Fistulifera solaris]
MMIDRLELDKEAPLLWITGEERHVPLQMSTEAFLHFWGVPDVLGQSTALNTTEPDITVTAEDVKEEEEENRIFQTLERKKDTITQILRSLTHIREFYRDTPKTEPAEKKDRRSLNQRRIKALEHQQERLQKRLSSNEEEEDDDDDNSIDAAWLVLVKLLNSLSVVTPIILGLCYHDRRNDESLIIQGTQISTKGNKPTCWMIGDKSFDVCKTHTRGILLRHLAMAFELLDVPESDLRPESNVWKEKLRSVMSMIVSNDPSRNIKSPTAGSQEFHAWLQSHREKSKDVFHKLDVTYGLVKDKNEEKHQKYLAAIQKLHCTLSESVKRVYPDAVLTIYGSCLSDLSLGKNSDVDLSLHLGESERLNKLFESGELTPASYEKEVKKTVYKVSRSLEGRRKDFRGIEPVAWARVPVVRGTFLHAENPYSKDGSIDFDICFMNDIAVANSSLLREYSLVDPRAKNLMFAVKKWAKEKNIASAKDNTYSSYTWMCLVVFYLQHVGLVPNLQDKELMAKAGVVRDDANRKHSVNNLDTVYAEWQQVSSTWTPAEGVANISVSELLYGFFQFYAQFPKLFLISIKRSPSMTLPKTVFRKCFFGFAIEDPFETYDSHMPHNLGNHAQEAGMRRIIQSLKESEKYARECLTKAMDGKEGNEATLWPSNVVLQSTSGKQKRRDRRARNKKASTEQAESGAKKTNNQAEVKNVKILQQKSDMKSKPLNVVNGGKQVDTSEEALVEGLKSVEKQDITKLNNTLGETKIGEGEKKKKSRKPRKRAGKSKRITSADGTAAVIEFDHSKEVEKSDQNQSITKAGETQLNESEKKKKAKKPRKRLNKAKRVANADGTGAVNGSSDRNEEKKNDKNQAGHAGGTDSNINNDTTPRRNESHKARPLGQESKQNTSRGRWKSRGKPKVGTKPGEGKVTVVAETDTQ